MNGILAVKEFEKLNKIKNKENIQIILMDYEMPMYIINFIMMLDLMDLL